MDIKSIHLVSDISQESSGPSYSIPRLCETLDGHGVRALLTTLDTLKVKDCNDQLSSRPYHYKFPLGVGPLRLGNSPKMHKWLKNQVKDGDVDIVHNHEMWQINSLYPGWVTKGSKVKLMVSPRGVFSDWAMESGSRLKKVFWRLLQRPSLVNVACFHATGEHEYVDIRKRGFHQPVAIIPNGIDIPVGIDVTQPKAGRTLLFLGRIHPVKGLDLLLKAWRLLQSHHPDWNLEIAGTDVLNGESSGYMNKLKVLASSLKLNRVQFVGELTGEKKFHAYAKADLYILPSRSENFGVTVAESLAAGTPVITTTGTPWRELDEKGCGWCVDPVNSALSERLDKSMQLSRAELKTMGGKGSKWMVDHFSWDRVGRMMVDVYKWVLTGSNRPRFVYVD